MQIHVHALRFLGQPSLGLLHVLGHRVVLQEHETLFGIEFLGDLKVKEKKKEVGKEVRKEERG